MKKELRVKVWEKYGRHCAYCGKKIAYKDMHVDHIIPRSDIESTENIDNLNPSCKRCNLYKSNRSIEGFRELVGTIQNRLLKIFIFKIALDFHIIKKPKKWNKEFYFERISQCKNTNRVRK